MKKIATLIYILGFLLGINSTASAQWTGVFPGVSIKDSNFELRNNLLMFNATINLKSIKVKSNDAVILTPTLIKGAQKKEMASIVVYGRNNMLQAEREDNYPITGIDEISIKSSKRPSELNYLSAVAYENWMDGADLVITERISTCCNITPPVTSDYNIAYSPTQGLSEDEEVLALIEAKPQLRYLKPVAEPIKMRATTGSAYIDFPLNSIELDPNYRNNQTELAKITSSIDSVKNDIDIDLKSIDIIGYASPEGEYEVNARLAYGRTKALENYVKNLYNFDASFIHTNSVPENWAGLRKYLQDSNLPNRNNILKIIDDETLTPDAKDWRIKLNYPDTYNYLLANVFPSLRCSDYKITYEVAGYDDLKTIKYMMEVAPQKLSLNEMFLLAQTLEPGSEEFNNIFETAARMFPGSEIANLNAGNAAMSRGELQSAQKYLDKSGQSAEAMFARGMLAFLQGDKITAIKYIRKSGRLGLEDTDVVIEYLHQVK